MATRKRTTKVPTSPILEQVEPEPEEKKDHPDIEFDTELGKAIYRWTGHLKFIRGERDGLSTKYNPVAERIPMKITSYTGKCLECGKDIYFCTTRVRADEYMKGKLAHFVRGGENELPMEYCDECDPTKVVLAGIVSKAPLDGKIYRDKEDEMKQISVKGRVEIR